MTSHRISHLAAALVGVLTMSGIATQALAREIRVDQLDQLAVRGRPARANETVRTAHGLSSGGQRSQLWAMPAKNTVRHADQVGKDFGAAKRCRLEEQTLDAKTLVTTPILRRPLAMSYVD